MVTPSMDLQAWLRKQLEESQPDLLREIVQTMAEALKFADADVACNAVYGKRTEERTNRRNGYRTRRVTRSTERLRAPGVPEGQEGLASRPLRNATTAE